MSPNLFNLYINDIPNIFDNDQDSPLLVDEFVHCLLYADDLIVFSTSLKGLQSKVDRLSEYCNTWDLAVNVSKTEVMAISHDKKFIPGIDIKLNGVPLRWVNHYKYLGIVIHNDGNMVASTENLSIRGWKAVFGINMALKSIESTPELRIKLFDKVVRPILCYNSELWGSLNNLYNCKNTDQLWTRLEK